MFGEVFLAKARGIEEGEEQTVVLVKSLLSKDELSQAEFRRQVDMFSKLNHNNIVRLLGLCEDTEPHYMILEYIDLVKKKIKKFELHVATCVVMGLAVIIYVLD